MSENEPFVDPNRAAEFLSITRRRVLEMARAGEIPAHAIGEASGRCGASACRSLRKRLSPKSQPLTRARAVSSTPAVPGNRIGGTR